MYRRLLPILLFAVCASACLPLSANAAAHHRHSAAAVRASRRSRAASASRPHLAHVRASRVSSARALRSEHTEQAHTVSARALRRRHHGSRAARALPAEWAHNDQDAAASGRHRREASAFVQNTVAREQAHSPATMPALATGVADEVANESAQSANQGEQPNTALKLAPAPDHLSARSMPGSQLIAGSSAQPHIPTIEEQVLSPTVLPATQPMLYNRRGRLIMPHAMKGSREILVHQNTMADAEGLARIQDDEDLLRMRSSRLLVPLPQNAALQVDERLPTNRRYCRPWTEVFLATLAHAHYERFHTPLQVNSAVRTVAFQERLIHTNGNAAPAEGMTASPHLTGQAVDLAKHGLSTTEIAWLRGYLMPLVQEGKIDVEEEFQQSCFHISVYKGYLPQPSPRRVIAEQTTGSRTAALASALR